MISKYPKLLEYRIAQGLAATSMGVTLIVLPWTNYDPISLPKMFVLSVGAFSLVGLYFSIGPSKLNLVPRPIRVIFPLFCLSMLSTTIFSGARLDNQFWGTFGRNTGILTYSSLFIILIVSSTLQDIRLIEKVFVAFILTSIPMTLYCLIQVMKLDPIPWSEKFAFGTLGNVNFLSAFFGMTAASLIVYSLDSKKSFSTRVSMIILGLVQFLIAAQTKSIQGPILFVGSLALLPAFMLLNAETRKKYKWYYLPYFFVTVLGFIALLFSLANKGPLAKVVYQPSILFRADYMHAGWAMTLLKPLYGVGMDSYGSWYREVRGLISTTRTGPGRTSNTAHNIFLDVSSNGGLPLGFLYLALTVVVAIAIIRLVRSSLGRTPLAMALVVSWIGYQIQSLISINQIGVGIWGWTLSGLILALTAHCLSESESSEDSGTRKRIKQQFRGKTLQASTMLRAVCGMAIGAIVAFPPLMADANFRKALTTRNFENILQSTNKVGATEFHRELLVDFAQKNGLVSETRLAADNLVKLYPRNFYGWRILSVAAASTEDERAAALSVVRRLDPYNPELG